MIRLATQTGLMMALGAALCAMPARVAAQRTDEGFRQKEPNSSQHGQAGEDGMQPGQLLEKYGQGDGAESPTARPAQHPVVVTPPPAPIPAPKPAPAAPDDRPAFLGVHYELSRNGIIGSYVTEVEPGTPAAAAGIHMGDVITRADGQPLDELEDLVRIISAKHVGEKIPLTVNRAGRVFTVHPVLAERTRELVTYQYNSPDGMLTLPNGNTLWIDEGDKARPFLGVTFRREERILSIDGQTIVKAPASNDLMVAEVSPGSTAQTMGILPGDVITALNGHPLDDYDVLTGMLQRMSVGEEVRITYLRGGRTITTSGRLRPHPGGSPGMGMRMGGRTPIGGGPAYQEDYSMDRMIEKVKEMAAVAHANNARVVTVADEAVPTDEVAAIRKASGIEFAQGSTLPVEGFRITPYGSSGDFAVEMRIPSRGNTLIHVLDKEGNIAYSESLAAFSGAYHKTFKLPALEPSQYYLQVLQSGRAFTRKISIQ